MKNKLPKIVSSIRLPIEQWAKLRELMKFHRGRAWLERVIDREHKKMTRDAS